MLFELLHNTWNGRERLHFQLHVYILAARDSIMGRYANLVVIEEHAITIVHAPSVIEAIIYYVYSRP